LVSIWILFYFILTEMSQGKHLQADVFHSSHASEKERGGERRGSAIGGAEQRKRLQT
jgi:hypothetical protein